MRLKRAQPDATAPKGAWSLKEWNAGARRKAVFTAASGENTADRNSQPSEFLSAGLNDANYL